MIIVDTREKDEKIIKELEKNGVKVEIDKLEVGDYLIMGREKNVLIERKTWSDFIEAMYSGRLFEQLINLKNVENVEKAMIIEGSFGLVKRYHLRVSYNSVVGALNSVWLDFKIPTIHSFSEYFTALILVSIDRRLGKIKEKKELVITKTKVESIEEEALRVVASFPMISEKRAKEILEYFGSIHNFINNVERINEINGIGEKIKERVKTVINYDFKEKNKGKYKELGKNSKNKELNGDKRFKNEFKENI
jgi:Fanconi anemia group M protein